MQLFVSLVLVYRAKITKQSCMKFVIDVVKTLLPCYQYNSVCKFSTLQIRNPLFAHQCYFKNRVRIFCHAIYNFQNFPLSGRTQNALKY